MIGSKYVTTVKNEKVLKKDCRKIENEYYKIGSRSVKNSGDCYPINGRYYKDNTGYIVYDHLTKQYEINNSSYIKGVVSFDEKGEPELGFFKNNFLSARIVLKGNTDIIRCINYNILEGTEYVLDKTLNVYMHFSHINPLNILNYKKIDYGYKQSLNYNITKDIIDQTKDTHLEYTKYLKNHAYSYGLKKYIDGLSFGAEFETSEGVIPKKYCIANALVPLRDGSIKGLEYVTLPLEGIKGINALVNSSKLVNKYTSYDDTCSFHLHLGNIPRTESFITALFKLSMLIQDDMFKMFPLYKKQNLGFKRKNYTAPLPTAEIMSKLDKKITPSNLKENFGEIFYYLSDGMPYSEFDKNLNHVTCHPNDPNNTRKWNIRSRYHWINFVPLLFGNKETVEFRIHTPIKDPNKILYFLLMTSKIINFTKKFEQRILDGTIDKIVRLNLRNIFYFNLDNNRSNHKINSHLSDYYSNRVHYSQNQGKLKNFNYDEKSYVPPMLMNFDKNRGVKFLEENVKEEAPNNPFETSPNLYGSNDEHSLQAIRDLHRAISSDPANRSRPIASTRARSNTHLTGTGGRLQHTTGTTEDRSRAETIVEDWFAAASDETTNNEE